MEVIAKYFNKQPKTFFILLGILFTLVICVIDIVTKDFFVLEFYIIPVALAAWFAGRNTGYFMAILSAIATLMIDITETPHHQYAVIHYWNLCMNLGFF